MPAEINNNGKVLSLLFTFPVSLERWVDSGLFEREKLLYEKYLESGDFSSVYWFSYGANDETLCEELQEQGRLDVRVRVIQPPALFSHGFLLKIYSLLMPLFHFRAFLESSAVKSNQVGGAWSAILAVVLMRKPLILRAGYLPHNISAYRKQSVKAFLWRKLERLLVAFSSRAIITSKAEAESLGFKGSQADERHSKLRVIPNFVSPNFDLVKGGDSRKLLFVGRLSEEKNLPVLLEAISGTELELTIVGDGAERETLEKMSAALACNTTFRGRLPNDALGQVFEEHSVFVLPSFTEGNPKALMEAMYAGLRIVASDIPANYEVLKGGELGWLFPTSSPEQCRAAIMSALEPDSEARRMRSEAFARATYSLAAHHAMEADVFSSLWREA